MSHEKSLPPKQILIFIESLKKQIVNNRCLSIKNRLDENRQNLVGVTKSLCNLAGERNRSKTGDENSSCLLSERQKDAFDIKNGSVVGTVGCSDKDVFSPQDDTQYSSAILLGSSFAAKNAVRPIKLPEIKRLSPYTSWIFLDKNQRMGDDQSVVGRRRIYYDRNGGEALICSDSEQEIVEEEDKTDFVESEDYIIRMTTKEVGTSDTVMKLLGECFSCKPCEVKARYEALIKGEDDKGIYMDGINGDPSQPFFDKDLDAALDSFENLFCRRCLVFDCRLHGCSQDLVFPAEVQHQRDFGEDENPICGPDCYRLALQSGAMSKETSIHDDLQDKHVLSSDGVDVRYKTTRRSSVLSRRLTKSHQSQSALSAGGNAYEITDIETKTCDESGFFVQDKSPKTKISKKNASRRNRKRTAGNVTLSTQKRHKMVAPDLGCTTQADAVPDNVEPKSDLDKEDGNSSSRSQKKSSRLVGGARIEFPCGEGITAYEDGPIDAAHALTNIGMSSNGSCKQDKSSNAWRVIEKCLYRKGLEIFGYNSCLIARNLMSGMKTCMEVYHYMNCSENGQEQGGSTASSLAGGYSENVLRRRSKFLRRRGRVRRLKYTWKSAGYHSVRKRISEKKGEPCRQYNPCGCQSTCGKQCACLLNGTCCEKYCGCPKSCKNRFRGCHCAKSQCRSRQCPCFAADRECDPDVCRNCWVSCGDGSLGVPSQRGDNYECRNMKLFLKQQQRVLLGRSDVSGWGAFLKNSVCKHEYLGEYTGELISHREADKRGKIYDRENSSFLFNLNDQFVLDAFRKGDKLKFANHSPDPNCYAKVIMVAGDHRVGIFAKERITAGEELFYDYRYELDRAPAWARKPESSGSKKDDSTPSCGRPKKLA